MKYVCETIRDYIVAQSATENSTLRFVLPSYPSGLLLKLGEDLEEHFSRVEKDVAMIYGIAFKLGENWEKGGTEQDKVNLKLIKGKGWYNEGDNLTSLRNAIKPPELDNLIVILSGYEHIDDRASLQDFFHLDQYKIWEICMGKSFVAWIQDALRDVLNPEDSQQDYIKISIIFEALFNSGLADILTVSSYLQDLDFKGAMSENDVYDLILADLRSFNLPRMTGLAGKYAKKTPYQYMNQALDFFNYSMFLDASSRKKYIKKVTEFENENDDNVDHEALGNATLNDLKEYISKREVSAAGKLYSCDFIYLFEQVLNYKTKIVDKPIKDRMPKKVYGVPPEIFLKAIWKTLNEFKKTEKANLVLTPHYLKSIKIKSLELKHDFSQGADDEDYSAEGLLEDEHLPAKDFLKISIGGIDSFLERNVQIKLDNENEKEAVSIELTSLLEAERENDEISYKRTATAEPYLQFEVSLHYGEDNKVFFRQYKWALPQYHPSRLLKSLVKWARKQYLSSSDALPVFVLPHMSEIFKARDEEEVTRLLEMGLDKDKSGMVDLIDKDNMPLNDPLKGLMFELSYKYQQFLRDIQNAGFFAAVDDSFTPLRLIFTDIYEKFLEKNAHSMAGPLIIKSFMFIADEFTEDANWIWKEYLPASIMTPLHPVLIEMIQHQHSFLCENLCYYAKQLLSETTSRVSSDRRWARVADLARIQWPVFGALVNSSKNMSTDVRSFGYTHLIGKVHDEPEFVSTRLLLEPQEYDEDDISDTELFSETRNSKLIQQCLVDYRNLYPFADDGLSIGAYCGGEIQPVIAGIDSFLSRILSERGEREYSLQLTVFSESRDDSSVARWINAWKDRWQVAELSSGKEHYQKCRISISYRIISKEKSSAQFDKILKTLNMDLLFYLDFIRSMTSRFEPLGDICAQTLYRKFPILEKAGCIVAGGGKNQERERVISNHRFKLSTLHSEVLAKLYYGNINVSHGQKYAVMRKYDYMPWVNNIDVAHKQSTWVICIDPAVDDQLLESYHDEQVYKREIIGFGTGVGAHGENNFTVSTEHFFLKDIKQKMSQQINSLLGPWDQNTCEKIADSLTGEAFKITGLSVIKATGPIKYVHELIANAAVRKMIQKDENVFCDEIISLDAFLHWFDHEDDQKRPDLLRIKADIVEGCFHIDAQVIECKLAKENEGFLQKARQQLENGLFQLVESFKPRNSSDPEGIKDKPDQRYWWMQLHRLIASMGTAKMQNYKEVLTALERLSEGCFQIRWNAAAVAFWSDNGSNILERSAEWDYIYGDKEMAITVARTGKEYIKKVALESENADLFSDTDGLVFSYLASGPFSNEKREIEKKEAETEKIGKKNSDRTSEESVNIEVEVLKSSYIPERILLGSFTSGGKEVFWEYGHIDLPNRHLLIFGSSGTGKTYAAQALLWELSKARQNSMIVDYTSGYTSNQLEPFILEQLKPKQHIILKQPLSINPFRRQFDIIDDEFNYENSASTAQRVSGVFAGVYQLGDQQKSALYRAVRLGVEQYNDSFNMDRLISELENIQSESGPVASSAGSVISKIQPFVDMQPFGEEDPEGWEILYKDCDSRCHVIQLAGFVKDASRLITEFTLFDLYWYYRSKGSKNDPRSIILDEVQNLDHSLDSPLGQLLTEGRKFGISLILATQTLSNLSKDQQDRLFQASHQLFFKPAATEVKYFAQLLANATDKNVEQWIHNLNTLKRGECYSLGHATNPVNGKLEVNKAYRIKIKSLEERL
jgi:DNA phosphorothioation-dependent restriction protein DptH